MPLVKSSHLHAADYSGGIMTIHFKDGSIYTYHGVPAPTYQALLAAKSKGQFFKHSIQGKFPHRPLKKPPPSK